MIRSIPAKPKNKALPKEKAPVKVFSNKAVVEDSDPILCFFAEKDCKIISVDILCSDVMSPGEFAIDFIVETPKDAKTSVNVPIKEGLNLLVEKNIPVLISKYDRVSILSGCSMTVWYTVTVR